MNNQVRFAIVAITLAYVYYVYRSGSKPTVTPTVTSQRLNDLEVTLAKEQEQKLQLTLKKSQKDLVTLTLGVGYELTGAVHVKGNDLQYEDTGYQVKVSLSDLKNTAGCVNILWQANEPNRPIRDCLDVKGAHWYGGPETFSQRWPIQLDQRNESPYLSFDTFSQPSSYGSVLERYFLTSSGLALFIDHKSPLHIGYDAKKFCMRSDYDAINYPFYTSKPLQLNYTLCAASDVLQIHKALLGKLWRFPKDVPENQALKSPIWSTWARYKMGVTQDDVKNFTQEIVNHGFPASNIEIDDMYTFNYGDWEWDTTKFPDPKKLIDFIHKQGFSVTTWMMPFVNPDSKMFIEGMKNGFFVKDATGVVPSLVKWWQGIGALIDFTDPRTAQWFAQRLENLRKSGVDSFKFDAGENQYLPPLFKTHQQLENPMEFVKHYVEALRAMSDNSIEVRVGYQTQHVDILVRMMDKNSIWGYDNGLKTLIPSALHFGVIGYPFILPDMIGGNAYTVDSGFYGNIPERELFIRWLQVTAFLPSMQFSIVPWQYDKETIEIALKFVKLHQDFVAPKVIKLAKESTQNGLPIIRPIWWIDPKDPATFDLDSQFLIGDDVLVAPILDKGATKRDVYIPDGTWKDLRDKSVIKGPRTLKDYSVKLDEIGLFQRV